MQRSQLLLGPPLGLVEGTLLGEGREQGWGQAGHSLHGAEVNLNQSAVSRAAWAGGWRLWGQEGVRVSQPANSTLTQS